EGHREMGLAHSGWAEQQERIPIADPAAGSELLDELGIEGWLGVELEALERAHEGELGDGTRHLDAPLVLARDLGLAEELHGVEQRELAPASGIQEAVELIADGGEFEAREHARERFEIGIVGRCLHQPPPTTASYS